MQRTVALMPSTRHVLACALVIGWCLGAPGCTRPSPDVPAGGASPGIASSAAPPLTPTDKATVDRVVGAWSHTVEWVSVPPLSSLNWRVLAKGDALPADTLIITDKSSRVTLRLPSAQFKPAFLELVRAGRVVGYQAAGDDVDIEVQAETLYPLRPAPDANQANVSLKATVAQVTGTAVYTLDREAVARNYTALTAHNPPFVARSSQIAGEPALPPQPVHVKKGLGIRGKDLSSLDPEAIRRMYLDSPDGVYVDAVFPGSPADRAGIQAHDVITRFNGIPVRNAQELLRALEATAADKTVNVEVVRTIIDKKATQSFTYPVTVGGFSGNAHVLPTTNPTNLPEDDKAASPAAR